MGSAASSKLSEKLGDASSQQLSDIVSGLSHEEKGKIQAALDGIAGPAKALDPLDAKLANLQTMRDAADDELFNASWWGFYAKKFPKRARSLDECKIWVIRSEGGYPSLCYAVGEPNEPKHLYSRQYFLLRNQWDDRGIQYWYADACANGVLDATDPDQDEAFRSEAEKQSSVETSWPPLPVFTHDMQAMVLKVVLPTVMRIDESHSADGRSLEDLGYTYGEDVKQGTEPDKHGGEVRIWRNDLLGMGRTEKLRQFKALQLLSADAA
eukprot:s6181_g4.t1